MSSFISRWKTNNDFQIGSSIVASGPSNRNQIRLPLIPSGTYNFTVNWGDGSTSNITTWDSGLRTHTYSLEGSYTVTITGVCNGWSFDSFGDCKKLINVTNWGTLNLGNVGGYFSGCTFLTSLVTGLDMTGTTDFTNAFHYCSNLTSFPFLNTSNVTNFSSAWASCNSLTSFPILDTSNATNFYYAWASCGNLASFPLINASNVTNFDSSWRGCNNLASFPLINTSSGTNFTSTWLGCSDLTVFPLLNTSSGINFTATWSNCTGLTSFPLINTSNGANFEGSWAECTGLTSFPLIDTANGINFSYAWYNCNGLTSFPLIDTANGIDFSYTWWSCDNFTSFPLIDTSSGTDFELTWTNCTGLTSFSLINTSSGINFINTWGGCTGLTSFPLINASNGTDFTGTWYNCSNLTSFPLIDISSALNLSQTWRNCTDLTSFPLLNTSNVTNFDTTWLDCTSLTSFPLLNFSNGTNFNGTWRGCVNLTTLPIGFGSTMSSMNIATFCFLSVTLTIETYSRLLSEIEAVNSNNNVTFHAGLDTNYNNSGQIARNALVADHNWNIIDGGWIPNPTGVILNGTALSTKESLNNKTIFPLQIISGGSIVNSDIFDISKNKTISIFANYANNIVSSSSPISFKVEFESEGSWITSVFWQPSKLATVVSSIVGSTPSETNTINVSSSNSSRASGQLAFIRHQINASPLDLSKSEFVKFKQINNTVITLVDATKYDHTSNVNEIAYLYSSAFNWLVYLDVSSFTKVRFLIDASQASQQFVFESFLILN